MKLNPLENAIDRSVMAVLITLCLSQFVNVANAQTAITRNIVKLDSGSQPAKATIEKVAWLTGHWTGIGLGGKTDEMWTPAVSGHMSGTFRVFRDGKLQFSEYFTIAEIDGSLTLSLLHFNPGLQGWEEKGKPVTYRLVNIDGDKICFDGLTYEKTGPGKMRAIVAMKTKEKSVKELVFEFTKSK